MGHDCVSGVSRDELEVEPLQLNELIESRLQATAHDRPNLDGPKKG